MTCDFIRQLLLALNLDENSRQAVAKALAHLETCEPCRNAMHDFDQIGALLGSGERAGELPEFGEIVRDELAAPQQSPSSGQKPHISDSVNRPEVSPAGGWRAFEDELLAASNAGRKRSRARSHPSRGRWWLSMLGLSMLGSLAAMVLVGWAAVHRVKPTSGVGGAPAVVVRPTRPTPLPGAQLAPEEVARKVLAFGKVDEAFNGHADWLLLTAQRSDVGLSNRPAGYAGPSSRSASPKVLLVRLSLLRGSDVVSNADVLIVAGTTANVVVPTKLGVPLNYQIITSALDPMHLNVRVEISKTGVSDGAPANDAGLANAAVAVLGTSLRLQPYRDVSAGTFVLDRGAFDLQVTAAPSDLPG